MAKARILIADDNIAILRALSDILESQGYQVETAETGRTAISKFEAQRFDAVLLDITMEEQDIGVKVLKKMVESAPDTPVIMISGGADTQQAARTIQYGAYDYLAKPLDLQRVMITVKNALDKSNLVTSTDVIKKKLNTYEATEIIGKSAKVMEMLSDMKIVAPTDATVLITGPNGGGKELVAQWLHENSSRRGKPIITVNCAAIPTELVVSELFGHMKGSFTGAHADFAGKFEQAHGGTLFLDEIGDMPIEAQAKMLTALETRKITRIGGKGPINVDVRVVAATNQNLLLLMRQGRFREDLYYRLNVIEMKVPSLNERRDDVPLLADFFIERYRNRTGIIPKFLSPEAISLLQQHDWKGNVRELRNVVERLMILGSDTITAEEVRRHVMLRESTFEDQLQSLFNQFNNKNELLDYVGKLFEQGMSHRA